MARSASGRLRRRANSDLESRAIWKSHGRSMTDNSSSKPLRRAASETGDPFLLTPGPLTTSRSVKAAMVHDWGSRDAGFLAINKAVLQRLPEIAKGGEDYVTVPVQGSGTFAVEAMLTSFVPPKGRVLLLVNGAYGHRAKRILEIARRRTLVHETPEDTVARPREGGAHLEAHAFDHPYLRGPLRDDLRHPQPDRRDRRARRRHMGRAFSSIR